MNSDFFLHDLAARAPELRVLRDSADVEPWLTDWRGLYQGQAFALLEPRTTAEVVAIVKAATAYCVPLVPQGGNTSMVGGATPDASGRAAILSLRRMNVIRRLDPEALTITVEAGVILQHLHEQVAQHGLRFPLTLGARGSATIGGLTSTNAGGTQVLRFGTMRRLVLGVEAVLADGEVHDGLSPLKKDNRGYDLDGLLVGAEGTLGIITAVALKLVPAARETATAWLAVASPHDALAILRRLERDAGDAVESFEILPQRALDLVLRHVPSTRSPLARSAPWHVLIDLVGEDAPTRLVELLASIVGGLASDAAFASSTAQAAAMWRLRDAISEAERAEGPTIAHDISVPVDRMPAFMLEAAETVERRFPGVHAGAFGHLGDGNVHFHVGGPRDRAEDWRERDGSAITAFVHDLVVAAGGSISAEHGIGQMKRDELQRVTQPARLQALMAIKQALDPLGIFNPGKLVPVLAPNARSE